MVELELESPTASRWSHSKMPALVNVWTIPVRDCDMRTAWSLLRGVERSKAETFHRPQDGLRYALARAAQRKILAAEMGCNPSDLEFSSGPNGKPMIRGAGVGFNTSHAGDWVWIAAAAGQEVGIDVEQIADSVDMGGPLTLLATPEEVWCLERTPAPEKVTAFFTWWTRKEAYLKGLGTGLVENAREATTWRGNREPLQVDAWRILSMDAARGYDGALSVNTTDCRVHLREWCW